MQSHSIVSRQKWLAARIALFSDWARPGDIYGKGGEVEANGRYHAPSCGSPARAAAQS
jgi:hypothetical protein